MKKPFSSIFILIFLAGFTYAADLRIEVKTHYYQPKEQAFQDIYGSGPQYGGEFNASLLGGLGIWLGFDF